MSACVCCVLCLVSCVCLSVACIDVCVHVPFFALAWPQDSLSDKIWIARTGTGTEANLFVEGVSQLPVTPQGIDF